MKSRAVVVLLLAWLVIRKALQKYRQSRIAIREHQPTPIKYAKVQRAFEGNFASDRELGAQVCAFVKGAKVLDLSGGRDSHSFNDLTIVFSCSKVIESLAVAMLVDQHKLAYEDPIAKHWPEFGQVFSPHTTVAQLMRHEAGLDQIPNTISLREAEEIFGTSAEALERWLLTSMKQRKDGTTRYHALSRGFFVDVLCTRSDGRRIRDFIREEVMGKLTPGDSRCEFHLGCHQTDVQHRTAECQTGTPVYQALCDYALAKSGLAAVLRENEDDPDYLSVFEADFLLEFAKGMTLGREYSAVSKTFFMVHEVGQELPDTANHKRLRKLPLSSIMGSTNAYSLARIGSELAMGGGALLSPEALALATRTPGAKLDHILTLPVAYTDCGWGNGRFRNEWMGWDGAGGSMFVWSEKHQASFAYVPSMLDVRLHRARALQMLNKFIQALEEE